MTSQAGQSINNGLNRNQHQHQHPINPVTIVQQQQQQQHHQQAQQQLQQQQQHQLQHHQQQQQQQQQQQHQQQQHQLQQQQQQQKQQQYQQHYQQQQSQSQSQSHQRLPEDPIHQQIQNQPQHQHHQLQHHPFTPHSHSHHHPSLTNSPPQDGKQFESFYTIGNNPGLCALILTIISVILIVLTLPLSLFFCIKVVQEYERAVIFRLGRLVKGGAKGPGIFFIIPCIDTYSKVDLRTVSFDVPPQEILSKDSVTVAVDAVVYYRISNATIAVSNVEDYGRSTRLLAATTLRNVLGTKNLSEILSERESISHVMQSSLDEATDPWGVKVERVEIKDARLPVQLQRAMATEAEAAREARAKVIAAEGEQRASRALKEAAEVIHDSPAALQLRYLQTLNSIAAEKNSTIVFPLPIDLFRGFLGGHRDEAARNRRNVQRNHNHNHQQSQDVNNQFTVNNGNSPPMSQNYPNNKPPVTVSNGQIIRRQSVDEKNESQVNNIQTNEVSASRESLSQPSQPSQPTQPPPPLPSLPLTSSESTPSQPNNQIHHQSSIQMEPHQIELLGQRLIVIKFTSHVK